ncbi:MAG: cytochrome c biogenesis protein CcsA [Phycisphaerales bacterium]|nr:cytochrome c biogenesis protein CcsA [Phycisphaerales bacterium]
MGGTRRIAVAGYWVLSLAALAGAAWLAAYYAPVDADMGVIQKVFYFHLPAALCMFGACGLVFVAGVGYLWQREGWWDDLSHASARVAVLLSSVVLLTGMIWGKQAWGTWWTWSPRLTFSLVLWLLYVAYLVLRASIGSEQKRAVVCAVYGIVAFLDVPLVYLSTKLMPDIHPESIELERPMWVTLGAWMAAVTLLSAGLVAARYRVARLERAHEEWALRTGMGGPA